MERAVGPSETPRASYLGFLLRCYRNSKTSRRQRRRRARLAALHARVANIRRDAAHKATTSIARRFETVVIEDLNVSGMSQNHALAGAVLDCGFGEIRRQLECKTRRHGGTVALADRWYPSSKTCLACGHVVPVLPLATRRWEHPVGRPHGIDAVQSPAVLY